MKSKERDYKKALYQIAMMGHGMKDEIRDWQQIGRNAVFVAREVLTGKCPTCNHPKAFRPKKVKS